MSMNTSSGVGSSSSREPRKTSNQNIQVYVRVRPMNTRERMIRSSEVIDVVSPREIVTRHSLDSKLTKKFTFDRTFGTDSRQVEVYSTVVAPLIEEVLSGYNCTVFAYGQTGTGKTHTMVGTECAELKSSWEDDSDIGIIPRALSHLFDELRMLELEFSMRISYLELYNEELCDLLSSDDSTKIRIFDDSTKKGSVIIQGLEEIPVHSKDDVYKLLEKGKERRKTATTLMNAQSSRSHTVFSILVHIRENGMEGEEMLKIGKLNLVDLAGSENVSKAGNEKGIRVRETVNINQSLLTLGRVITALVERTPHVPYRESKLTRLLQESLGGRTKTSIIATISPGHKDIEETLSTLEYAHRAKNIQNKPEVNQKLTKKTVLKEYTDEIDKLKRDLIAARDKNGIYLAEETYNDMTNKMDSQNRELNEKMLLLKALKDEMQNKERIFNEVSLNLVEKTEVLKRTEQDLSQTKGVLQQTKKFLNDTKRRYKEKKVLLKSHVKTEEVLTDQATQILEVADIATKDTHQLHSTLERRKDVDRKIETAAERFTAQMQENFEMMNNNLGDLQKQHASYAQMITEEFGYVTKVHDKLITEANQKIKKVSSLCEKSLAATSAVSEKYATKLSDLSTEHKTTLQALFQELQDKQQELNSQIQQNLCDMESSNVQQKSHLDALRTSIAEKLQHNTSNFASQMEQIRTNFIAPMKEIAEGNAKALADVQSKIEKEREIAQREQKVMDDFVKQMHALKEERTQCSSSLNSRTLELDASNKESMSLLKDNTQYTQKLCKEQEDFNAAAQEQLEKQVMSVLLCVDQSVAKCSTLQMQLNNLCEESSKDIDALGAAENLHCERSQQVVGEKERELLDMRTQYANEMTTSAGAVERGLADDMHQLKKHLAMASGFSGSLQEEVHNYAKVYAQQMESCINDVTKFKQSELKVYAPTGTTPSKRDFVYPRVLAATSPHNRIVNRFRMENDLSDLDTTTGTIDEGSEIDLSETSVPQEISDAETVLNSTPILSPNVTPNKQKVSIKLNDKNWNVLKPSQSESLLSSSYSSGKLSPRRTSPGFTKANKENI